MSSSPSDGDGARVPWREPLFGLKPIQLALECKRSIHVFVAVGLRRVAN
jgi:hypothetical protein